MALTDIAVKSAKPKDKPKDKPYKLSDGDGMYLLVTTTGKYWRFDYRFLTKRKTLAIGVYPTISLADALTRIIYNTDTGALYYDADGSGAGLAFQIALIGIDDLHPSLSFSDFAMV